MSLQFILGSAGSGKSWHMYHEVTREAQAHPDDHYFVIVPEQFNMQTQRDLVLYSPSGGILNIDIVSFPRLAQYIFEETGTDPGKVLTDTGKNLVLRQAAVRVKDRLSRLGNRLDRPGCIPQIKSLLSEFGQYNVTPDEIDEMISLAEGHPALQEKLRDIQIISRSFDDYRREKYITSEEVLKVLAQQIRNSELLRGAHLYFNGFTGFTPVQMLVLEELLRYCAGLTIALTMDPAAGFPSAEKQHDLFYLTGKTVRDVSRTAVKAGAEVLDSVVLTEQKRLAPGSGLERLERRLLRFGTRVSESEESPEDIHILEAADPLAESYFAANRIWQLTHEEGYRYSEIAVICADLPSYENQLSRVFEEYGIPCFLDHKNAVSINPCLEMIRAAIRLVEENWSYTSVFHFLRTGYSGLSGDEIDCMENYVLAFGIRGRKRWTEEWQRSSKEFPAEELPKQNALRERLLKQLLPFAEAFSAKENSVSSYTEAVRILLTTLGVEKHLQEEAEKLRGMDGTLPESISQTMAMEYDQIWTIIQDVIEEADRLMGTEIVPREEFAHILETGFAEARVGVIPPGIDEVCIGDLVRTRLKHIRVLFFVGVCDGAVPAHDSGNGLLSQMERQFLSDREINLAPDARQEGFIQRFYLYQMLTKPSDMLYLSYAQTSSRGDSLRPSYLIYHLQKILPGLRIESTEDTSVLYGTDTGHRICSPRQGFRILADALRQDAANGKAGAETLQLLQIYSNEPAYAACTGQLLRAAEERGEAGRLKREVARELYGNPLVLSVSGLEDYGNCPFMYFVSHGLQLKERQILTIASSDTGTFMHEAMYRFASAMSEDDWRRGEEELLAVNLEDAVQQAQQTDAQARNLFGDTAANRYMLTRMMRALRRSAWAMTEQIRSGLLLPAAMEQRFVHQTETEDGTLLRLKGTIDRLDMVQEDGTVYLRIVDYKSSARKIDLAKFLMGVQLQLPLYMKEAQDAAAGKYPDLSIRMAAGLYAQLTDPVLSAGRDGIGAMHDEAAEHRAFLQKMRPDGLINSDMQVLQLMDQNLEPGGSSLVLPVALNKDGSIKKTAGTRKAAADQELKALSESTGKIVKRMASEILSGSIDISPLMSSPAVTACTWCRYQDVCGRDPRLKAFGYRKVPRLGRDEAWEKIMQLTEEEKS